MNKTQFRIVTALEALDVATGFYKSFPETIDEEGFIEIKFFQMELQIAKSRVARSGHAEDTVVEASLRSTSALLMAAAQGIRNQGLPLLATELEEKAAVVRGATDAEGVAA